MHNPAVNSKPRDSPHLAGILIAEILHYLPAANIQPDDFVVRGKVFQTVIVSLNKTLDGVGSLLCMCQLPLIDFCNEPRSHFLIDGIEERDGKKDASTSIANSTLNRILALATPSVIERRENTLIVNCTA